MIPNSKIPIKIHRNCFLYNSKPKKDITIIKSKIVDFCSKYGSYFQLEEVIKTRNRKSTGSLKITGNQINVCVKR